MVGIFLFDKYFVKSFKAIQLRFLIFNKMMIKVKKGALLFIKKNESGKANSFLNSNS